MSDIVIYHNPTCGTSRTTLALLQEKGHQPQVIEYLKEGWTREQLKDLIARSGLTAHQILRDKGTNAAELGLTDPATSEDAIIAAMILEPILVNRPIVSTPKGAALCRPAELVLSLL